MGNFCSRWTRVAAPLCLALALQACGDKAAPPPEDRPWDRSLHPLFINNGFEQDGGSLNNWTRNSYLNNTIIFPVTQRSDLQLVDGGVANTYARTADAGTTISGMTAGTGVPTFPRIGTTSAVVNESPLGNNSNVNSLKQSFTVVATDVDPADGKVHVRFVIAPALQAAGHVATEQPYFYVQVRNTTQNKTLHTNFNYSTQPGLPWLTQGTGNTAVLYTDWQIYDITTDDTSLLVGDVIELEVIAAGCSHTAHWGEVYVDGFGSDIPTLWIQKTAPAFVNADSDLTYTFKVTNGSGGLAPNVVATETTPVGTTFVSIAPPTGVTCTVPDAGLSGTISCPLGSMNAGAEVTFSATVHVSALPATPPANRDGGTSGDSDRIMGGGASTHMQDDAASWTTDQWVGWTVFLTDGTGEGQSRTITANDSNTLTISPAWVTNPRTTSYMILPPTVTNGEYTVAADTISKIIGTKVLTAITPTTTYTDLTISVDDNTPALNWGGAYSGTIVVKNNGPTAVTGAKVSDTFPAAMGTVNWTCTPMASCPATSGSGNLSNALVNLAIGASVTFSFSGNIIAGSGTSSFTNSATVATPTGVTDNTPINNSDSDYDTIGAFQTLSFSKTGGTGIVYSVPVGVYCGTACGSSNVNFATGTSVTLTAVAAPGETFVGWGGTDGAACGSALTCTVNMSQARTVTASFNGCGNGTLETGEGCDDGNSNNTDACNNACKITTTNSCNITSPGLTGSASCASAICNTGSGSPGVCAAAGACGNGVLESGEGCDDGNIVNNDACNNSCKITTTNPCNATAPGATGATSCASNICNTGNGAPGVCAAAGVCGNGILDSGEGCDDGNSNNTDTCNNSCKITTTNACNATAPGATGNTSCASNICNTAGGAPGVCSAANVCGNGVLEAGEGCDDGNSNNTDACNNSCKITTTNACNVNAAGATGSLSCASGICNLGGGSPGICSVANVCGNGVLETGEGCDDGNSNNTDACNNACKVTTTNSCNANNAGVTGALSCASGICNTGNGAPGICAAAGVCGNGVLETGEGCDDGNSNNTDACNNSCKITTTNACNATAPGSTGASSCASAICNTGNGAPGVCSAPNTCGNGVLEAGEGCDDGNSNNTDTCNNSCKITTTNACNINAAGATGSNSCASGICNTGNGAPGVCSAPNACGNGVLETGEGCDDGNSLNSDACSNACLVNTSNPCNANTAGTTGAGSCVSGICNVAGGAPGICSGADVCGNGIREAGEGCDDGNTVDTDNCNNACRIKTTVSCNVATPGDTGNTSCASGICNTGNGAPGVCSAPNVCGNGVLESGEGCDDGNSNNTDACNNACKVTTTNACNANTAGATGAASCASGICNTGPGAPGVCAGPNVCGNGVLESGEGCDDGNSSNTDACNTSCKIQNNNPCNANTAGVTGNTSCVSGLCDMTGGAPGVCKASNVCGNGTREAGEGCDDGNMNDTDACNNACLVNTTSPCNATMPGLVSNASCSTGICNVGPGAPGVCAAPNVCGNGVLESGEGCDDGNSNNTDTCNNACKITTTNACNATAPGATGNTSCASGICNVGPGAPGICAAPNVCGNGVLESGEGCDDGNMNNTDTCNNACKITTTNACNVTAPGATGSSSCASGICNLGGGAPGVCSAPNACGNGVLESGEGCDDGNSNNTDACNNACKITTTNPCNATAPGATGSASCASGVCDVSGGSPGICKPSMACGNHVLEAGEGCDTASSQCNSNCQVVTGNPCNATAPGATGNASCASGLCDTFAGSPGTCKDPNTCGNHVLETGEGCDNGSSSCNSSCKVIVGGPCNISTSGLMGNQSCVSGICDSTEAPPTCEAAMVCGNHVLETGEGCDDGNTTLGDGCSATCKVETGGACNATAPGLTGSASCAGNNCDTTGGAPGICRSSCGNGTLNADEGCDDSNMMSGDGCSSTCKIETGNNCNTNASGLVGSPGCVSGVCDSSTSPGKCEAAMVCGNNKLEANEGCDDGNNTSGDGCTTACLIEAGGTCNVTSPGLMGGSSCLSGICNTSTTPGRCAGSNTCGNNMLEAGEGCDDGNTMASDGCSATCLIEDANACNATTPGVTGNGSCASGNCDMTGGAPGLCVTVDHDGDGIPDTVDLDDDNDGLLDTAEGPANTDTDGDGVPDSLDLDSDNDGIPDVVEAGHTLATGTGALLACTGGFGTNGFCDALETAADSGSATFTVRDTDGDTIPDFRDLDSDNDGRDDLVEAGHHLVSGNSTGVLAGPFGKNGLADALETAADSGQLDFDGNGTADLAITDTDGDLVADYRDLDSDNDGIGDLTEGGSGCTDTAHDGVCDGPDQDNDGIVDSVDGKVSGFGDMSNTPPTDTDGDGVADYRDLDSDNDGLGDLVEGGSGCADTGIDGICDGVDTDGDGLVDGADSSTSVFGNPMGKVAPDTDADGVADFRDLDSDNDGISDLIEGGSGCADMGRDGVCDPGTSVADSDGDGVVDSADGKLGFGDLDAKLPPDTDGDGVADFRDLDSDNDGLDDLVEGGSGCQDTGKDGVCDGSDTDGDGVLDVADGKNGFGDLDTKAVTDTDTDSVPDFRDIDSDNDGINDLVEGGSGCFDGGRDGVCDGVDTDGDGIVDGSDGKVGFADSDAKAAPDTDGDGVPDFRDLDTDNDGIDDVVEGGSGCADTAKDGICDGGDSDGDGVVDGVDGKSGFGDLDAKPAPDTDGDLVPDFRDLDTDNDGISDVAEGDSGCVDADQDAVCDGNDTDGDGILDGADGKTAFGDGESKTPPDSDGDGVPDYRDLDTDNDGISDVVEGGSGCADADNNGVCDAGDTDGDGVVDSADGSDDRFGKTPVSGTSKKLPPDTDGDGTPDYRDLDADGDGIFDILKVNPALDGNKDGTIDVPTDTDGDGIADVIDANPGMFGGIAAPSGSIYVGGGGCGCGSTNGTPYGWFALLALVALRRRLRPLISAAALAGVLLLASPALAQQSASSSAIDVQLFKTAPGRFDIMNVMSTQTCGHQCWNLGINFQYAMNPLLLKDANGNARVGKLVDNQLTADLVGSLGIYDSWELGIHLPLYVQSNGSSALLNPKFAGEGWLFGAGDLRFIPRVRFHKWDSGFGLGLALPIILPTGRTDSFMGGGFVAIQPRLLAEFAHERFRIDANLGVNIRRLETIQNLTFGNEFAWGAAGELPFKAGDFPMAVTAAIHGLVGFDGMGTHSENKPMEADVGFKAQFGNWVTSIGVGRGIMTGYGSPDVRAMLGVGYQPVCGDKDSDKDGLPDSVDKCPFEPEDKDAFEDGDGCPDPDNDKDGILDVSDKCPMDPEDKDGFEDENGCPDPDNDKDGIPDVKDKCPLVAETMNGFQDEDGCPDKKPAVDSDGDGLFDDVDKCPNAPEDRDGFEDEDGCPDPDNDKDGVLDAKDKCPLVPETINGFEDEDGCPDKGKSSVRLEGNKIVILEKVYFATNKDIILDRSFKLLNEVASTLKAHRELTKVRVEGHTDSQGDDASNMDLSQRRAESVKRFLVKANIEANRLEAKGYGETRPVDTNSTAAGREMNRRVEFIVVETAPQEQ